MELTEEEKKKFTDIGVTNPTAHLLDLIAYEEYIYVNYPSIGDEAWTAVQNEEE